MSTPLRHGGIFIAFHSDVILPRLHLDAEAPLSTSWCVCMEAIYQYLNETLKALNSGSKPNVRLIIPNELI